MTQTKDTSSANEDILFLRELKIETIIGVFDWERDVPQTLAIDAELHVDMSAAGTSDNVGDALSYVDVADEITAIALARKAKLVEYLAEEIASALFEKWPIQALRLRITKPTAVAAATGVGVEIFRRRP